MPCNQVVRTRLRVRDEAMMRQVVAEVAPAYLYAVSKAPDGTLMMNSGVPWDVRGTITGAYADAMLVKAMSTIGFAPTGKTNLPSEMQKEIGPGVLWTFVSLTGKTIVIGRANDGRLHFEMAGYSAYEARDAANAALDAMRVWGIEATEPITIKTQDERWFEEKLPSMEPE